jgi:DNA-binding transcriptional ArsR family regulator
MDPFERRFRKSFPVVAFTCNRHIVDHMRRLANGLDMDMETALLWGVTAHMNMARSIRPGAPAHEVMSAEGEFTGTLHPMRITDIAQVSGLPKETVRRKLERLRESGKLERLADGRWQVCSAGVDETAYQFTLDTVRRLLDTARQIEALLAEVDVDE